MKNHPDTIKQYWREYYARNRTALNAARSARRRKSPPPITGKVEKGRKTIPPIPAPTVIPDNPRPPATSDRLLSALARY